LVATARPGGGEPTATHQRAGSIYPLIYVEAKTCGLSPATGPFWSG